MRNRILAGILPLCGHKGWQLPGVIIGAMVGVRSAPGQRDPENGFVLDFAPEFSSDLALALSFDGAFHDNFATVILNDLLDDGQAQSGAVLLAIAYEGME
jgi:hypothetical protein